ncbi:MAG: VOC family protein [Pseudomonadota bacterium]
MLAIIPTLRYKNARAAIDWLCEAFGFEARLVVSGETDDIVTHAQLVYGDGMIMLGSDRDDAYGRYITVPEQIGGRTTQAPYVVVHDPDAHYARAKAAGATIVMDIEDQGYGGRAYSCLDPEGHLWNFGNYDPWKD